LRARHERSLGMLGIRLICSCGRKFVTHHDLRGGHTRNCGGRNFVVEKKAVVTTPECVLCEHRPVCLRGYMSHLRSRHGTTLKENGIYLRCSCGTKITCSSSVGSHGVTCDRRKFTVKRRNESTSMERGARNEEQADSDAHCDITEQMVEDTVEE
ncbi:hypothetical protein PFISCL1PPCAC_22554, partial [Pristionchus fissidentatus]